MGRKKNPYVLLLYCLYILFVCVGTTYFDSPQGRKEQMIIAMTSGSVALAATYGYYAIYRDFKLFGWKWIVSTFKQLWK